MRASSYRWFLVYQLVLIVDLPGIFFHLSLSRR